MKTSKKLTRRKVLTAFAAATTGIITARSAVSSASSTQNAEMAAADKPGHLHTEHKHGMPMNPFVDRFPRQHPDIVLSSPSQTMGRQMGRVVTPGKPPLGYRMDGDVKVFELIAQPVEVVTTERDSGEHGHPLTIPEGHQRLQHRPGQPKTMLAWGYNGNCPGPTLEAIEGDRVRIILRNELPEPTSIHWHGFELRFSQDGASGYHPFEAGRPVLPGQTEVYEFDLIQSGTLMYHTGFNVMKQEALGLSGAFVIHPRRRKQK